MAPVTALGTSVELNSRLVLQLVEHYTYDQEIEGLTLGLLPLCINLGQVIHTCLPVTK